MTFRERLLVQTMNQSAVLADLRSSERDPEVREAIHEMRRARQGLLSALWRKGTAWPNRCETGDWALARLRHRRGLDTSGWFIPGEKVEDHSDEADVLLLLNWLEEMS